MTDTHTPGPWTSADGCVTRVLTDIGRQPIDLAFSGRDLEEDVANARLVAAAPEMLALLREAADTIRDLKRRAGIVTIGRGACIESRVRWAIAKAGGRS